jgi:HEPN domain-containing protein
MKKNALAKDYFIRSTKRLVSLRTLLQEESYPDVVREAQELTELLLKGLMRSLALDPPRVHDVGPSLQQYKALLPAFVQSELPKIIHYSRILRKDREISFYGDDDLIPLDSYTQEQAQEAIDFCSWLLELLRPWFENIP